MTIHIVPESCWNILRLTFSDVWTTENSKKKIIKSVYSEPKWQPRHHTQFAWTMAFNSQLLPLALLLWVKNSKNSWNSTNFVILYVEVDFAFRYGNIRCEIIDFVSKMCVFSCQNIDNVSQSTDIRCFSVATKWFYLSTLIPPHN